ncbi:MAG: DUF1275 family protein [Phycisphaerales bacterium]
MLVSQAHSFTQQARLAITLAWVAGYTNILCIITCATATSHVTGTVSQWGFDIVEGRWDLLLFTSFLLVVFLLGAMISGLCTELGRRRGWESIYILPIAIQAAILSALALVMEWHEQGTMATGGLRYAIAGLASLAMGLQNATITRISGGIVRTTHVTGVVTDLGLESVQFLFWLRDRNADSPPLPPRALIHSVRVHPTARRLALLGSIIGSFALGAALGSIAHDQIHNWAMFLPVAFLLWIIVQDIRAPICEIESSDLHSAESGVSLPDGIAVFHLRKDSSRPGQAHRLPDLLGWCERLPRDKRVVILDLGDVTVFDANAALELRALIRQSQRRERTILISGINGEQYHTLREAGAGDALDPSNVCPDLELAVARGMLLLDTGAPTAEAGPKRPW